MKLSPSHPAYALQRQKELQMQRRRDQLDENSFWLVLKDKFTAIYTREQLHSMLEQNEITMFDEVMGYQHEAPLPIAFVTYPKSMKKQAKRAQKLLQDIADENTPANTTGDLVAGTIFTILSPMNGLKFFRNRPKTRKEQKENDIIGLWIIAIALTASATYFVINWPF